MTTFPTFLKQLGLTGGTLGKKSIGCDKALLVAKDEPGGNCNLLINIITELNVKHRSYAAFQRKRIFETRRISYIGLRI